MIIILILKILIRKELLSFESYWLLLCFEDHIFLILSIGLITSTSSFSSTNRISQPGHSVASSKQTTSLIYLQGAAAVALEHYTNVPTITSAVFSSFLSQKQGEAGLKTQSPTSTPGAVSRAQDSAVLSGILLKRSLYLASSPQGSSQIYIAKAHSGLSTSRSLVVIFKGIVEQSVFTALSSVSFSFWWRTLFNSRRRWMCRSFRCFRTRRSQRA